MFDLSVLIPVKDEEQNLDELVARLSNVVQILNVSCEIIFITDVNRDNTLSKLRFHNQKDERVKVLKLSNSLGQQIAVVAGLQQHCVIRFSGYVVGKTQRVRPDVGLTTLVQGGDCHHRHGEKRTGLIEIVDDSDFFES